MVIRQTRTKGMKIIQLRLMILLVIGNRLFWANAKYTAKSLDTPMKTIPWTKGWNKRS